MIECGDLNHCKSFSGSIDNMFENGEVDEIRTRAHSCHGRSRVASFRSPVMSRQSGLSRWGSHELQSARLLGYFRCDVKRTHLKVSEGVVSGAEAKSESVR
jgi:hypothetical protein